MLDAKLRPIIDPAIKPVAKLLAAAGISANMITLSALLPAVGALWALSQQQYLLALLLIILNRLLDGLDGLVARMKGPTKLGGYLDILCDFALYVSVPIGFGLASAANLQPAMLLIAAFTLTGVSFLAFASVVGPEAESTHGPKGFLYTTGLMEGAETIAFFIAFCLFPAWFAPLAYIFAALCILTVLQRSLLAVRTLR